MLPRKRSETPNWQKKVSIKTMARGGKKQGSYTMPVDRISKGGDLEMMVDTDRTITINIKQLIKAVQKLSLDSEMVDWELIE